MSMDKALNAMAIEIGQIKVNQILSGVNLETAKEENANLLRSLEEKDSIIDDLREEILRLQGKDDEGKTSDEIPGELEDLDQPGEEVVKE